MFCNHCGAQILESAKFCVKCGKKIENVAVITPTKQPVPAEELMIKQQKENNVESATELLEKSEKEPLNKSQEKLVIKSEGELKEEASAESKEKTEKELDTEKQEKLQEKSEGKKFCRKCGNPLKPGAKFCAKCGNSIVGVDTTDISQRNIPENDSDNTINPTVNSISRKASSSSKIIIIVAVGVALLAMVVGIGCKLLFSAPDEKYQDNGQVIVENKAETTQPVSEEATTENFFTDVDFNLNDNSRLTLTGFVEKKGSGWILQLEDKKSFGEQKMDGNSARLDGVSSVTLFEVELPENMLSDIKENERVTMTGQVDIVDDMVQMTPDEIFDEVGADRIALFEKKSENRLEQDYIIPYSDTELLTEEDVEGLSVQEINYAKNEIYARYGRKFASQELQDYFNSKDWYYGTIEPEDFDKGNYLSDLENKNAAFLSKVEKEMGVYQLDK